tara:strand:+ start:241 stop:468 length:228 start_codon:yes stop_codon:yes gene_type:complete
MAIKDWKKKGYNSTHILYVQKPKFGGWNETLVIRYFKPIWQVAISYERGEDHHTIKEFKTKSKALKFAKAYMRKH